MAFVQVLHSSSQIMNWKRSFAVREWATVAHPSSPMENREHWANLLRRNKNGKHFTQRQNIPHNIRPLKRYRYTALVGRRRRCCLLSRCQHQSAVSHMKTGKSRDYLLSYELPSTICARLTIFSYSVRCLWVCVWRRLLSRSIVNGKHRTNVDYENDGGGKNWEWLDLHTKTL